MVFNWRNNLALFLVLLSGVYYNAALSQEYKIKSSSSISRNVRNQTKTMLQDVRSDKNDTSIDDPDIKYFNNWSKVKQINVVNRIGHTLLSVSNIPENKQVTFSVERKYSANSYADLRDNIVIYRGILNYIENEDELAFVIGHELGHVEQKHVKKGFVRNVAFNALGITVGALTNTSTLPLSAGILADNKFSRNEEFIADQRSIDFLVMAGYNPLACVSILYKIGSNYHDFNKNHPSTNKRIYADYKYIEQKYPQYLKKGFNTQAYGYAVEEIESMKPVQNTQLKYRNKNKNNKNEIPINNTENNEE